MANSHPFTRGLPLRDWLTILGHCYATFALKWKGTPYVFMSLLVLCQAPEKESENPRSFYRGISLTSSSRISLILSLPFFFYQLQGRPQAEKVAMDPEPTDLTLRQRSYEVRRLEFIPPSVDIGHVNVNYGHF